mgnify:CR=1 FL=1
MGSDSFLCPGLDWLIGFRSVSALLLSGGAFPPGNSFDRFFVICTLFTYTGSVFFGFFRALRALYGFLQPVLPSTGSSDLFALCDLFAIFVPSTAFYNLFCPLRRLRTFFVLRDLFAIVVPSTASSNLFCPPRRLRTFLSSVTSSPSLCPPRLLRVFLSSVTPSASLRLQRLLRHVCALYGFLATLLFRAHPSLPCSVRTVPPATLLSWDTFTQACLALLMRIRKLSCFRIK